MSMMRFLTLCLVFVAVHGNDGSSSGAPSSLLGQNAPSVSFLPVSDSPASPAQDVPTIPTTTAITTLSPTTISGFQALEPNCGDCFW